jgi:hypothetical protein
VKGSFGLRTVPAGIVSSLIKRKLLQPTPNVEGFTVGVFSVPVGLTIGATIGVKLGTRVLKISAWVGNGNAVGVDTLKAVLVGIAVAVKVAVGGGAIAVWVWNMEAAAVPIAAVRIALTSGIGDTGIWPPQDVKNSPISSRVINVLRASYIFTSYMSSIASTKFKSRGQKENARILSGDNYIQ